MPVAAIDLGNVEDAVQHVAGLKNQAFIAVFGGLDLTAEPNGPAKAAVVPSRAVAATVITAREGIRMENLRVNRGRKICRTHANKNNTININYIRKYSISDP